MSNVYVIRNDGGSEPLNRVHCVNEDRELQQILEKNPDLLPGDQIDPEDPRRWLPIKREMPVPDPETGQDRWSVDFLFADHDAIPTFIECKRFADTRARREVVGQMFEYAANGHHYWTKDDLRAFAEETARAKGSTLDEAITKLKPTDCDSAESFFAKLQENLREGQIRIIFFMEESPMELRSVVDFLNKQMERSEILLVEAKQYSHPAGRIVVPTLFGYTEEARRVKRAVTITSPGARKQWDKDLFYADARQKLSPAEVQTIERFYNRCDEMKFKFSWGTGQQNGSFSIKEPAFSTKSLVSVFSHGFLNLNFGWWSGSEFVERVRDRLKELLIQRVGLPIGDDYKTNWPTFPISEWGPKNDKLADVLRDILNEFRPI